MSKIELDYEQRQRVESALEWMSDFPDEAAAELVYLRDRIVALEEDVRELADWWGSIAEEVERDKIGGDLQTGMLRRHEEQLRALLDPPASHETKETP